jgi:hypothetical protein
MKPVQALRFPHKQIRSRVIKDYVRAAGYRGVVVFSCGNSATALREQGLEVVEVGDKGDLKAGKWWTQAEIDPRVKITGPVFETQDIKAQTVNWS